MPQAVLEGAPGDYDSPQEIFEASDFFEVTIDGVSATITQVAVGLMGEDTLYLGTPRGAVEVTDMSQISSADVVIDSTLVPGTAGLIVEDIVTAGSYVVILTNHFLVYSTDGGTN